MKCFISCGFQRILEAESHPVLTRADAYWIWMNLGSPETVSTKKRILKAKVGERDPGSLSFLLKTVTVTHPPDLSGLATHGAFFWALLIVLGTL